VGWEEAQKSVRQVWNGLPDLKVELAPSWAAPTPPALQRL